MQAAKFAAGVIAGLMLPVVINGYWLGFQFMAGTQAVRKMTLSAWQSSKVMPHNAGLPLLYPFPSLESFGTTLENNRILKLKWWDPGVAANWNFNQTAVGNSHGVSTPVKSSTARAGSSR